MHAHINLQHPGKTVPALPTRAGTVTLSSTVKKYKSGKVKKFKGLKGFSLAFNVVTFKLFHHYTF